MSARILLTACYRSSAPLSVTEGKAYRLTAWSEGPGHRNVLTNRAHPSHNSVTTITVWALSCAYKKQEGSSVDALELAQGVSFKNILFARDFFPISNRALECAATITRMETAPSHDEI